MRLALALAVALALSSSGCSTLLQSSSGHGCAVMGGVRLGVRVLGNRRFSVVPEKVFIVVDMPLSFVFDVVLLPLSALNEFVLHDGIDVSSDALLDGGRDAKPRVRPDDESE